MGIVPRIITIRSIDHEVAVLMCDVLVQGGAKTVLLAGYPSVKKTRFRWR